MPSEPGIIQIGVQPEQLQELIEKIDIIALAKSLEYGENGYVYILDLDGNILKLFIVLRVIA